MLIGCCARSSSAPRRADRRGVPSVRRLAVAVVRARAAGGRPMAGVELFSHPAFYTRYRAGLCSAAALALLLIAVFTYVPPLLVAYRSQGERRSAPRGPARPGAEAPRCVFPQVSG